MTPAPSVERVAAVPMPRGPRIAIGRTFVHPVFDLSVIGGLLTLPVAFLVSMRAASTAAFLELTAPVIFLLCNQAHFAASTVRLYTKADTFRDLPFLTMGLPIVSFGIVLFFVAFADTAGKHFQALYLTWSPYHYAAQTFGLAAMYTYRSGCRLADRERAILRFVCMLPFARALLGGAPFGHGLGWLVPYGTLVATPTRFLAMSTAFTMLNWLSLATPLVLFGWFLYRARSGGAGPDGAPRATMPVIALVLMLSNATWWAVFPYWDAAVWATILHGLQYLGIMAIFHAEEQVQRPDNRRGRAYHVGWLLVVCVALGYGLFQCWPRAFMWAGYGKVESVFMVIAAVNLHHFIVDAYIWRIRKDSNLRTVVA